LVTWILDPLWKQGLLTLPLPILIASRNMILIEIRDCWPLLLQIPIDT
jgi:hypothetical protein